jgi:hypothetical protein
MEDDKPEDAPPPLEPIANTFVLRRDLSLLLADIPDSDLPTVAKIFEGLIPR